MKGLFMKTVCALAALSLAALGCGLSGGDSGSGIPSLPEPGTYTELKSQPPSTEGSKVPIEITMGVARRELNGWVFPGIIKNNSDQWIAVSLRVHLYDASGTELDARNPATGEALTASALNYYIPPQGIGPYGGMTDEASVKGGTPASYKMTVEKSVVFDNPPQIQVISSKFTPGDDASFSGEIKNTGAETCATPTITTIGYSADGRILDVEMFMLDTSNLGAGQSAPFDQSLLLLELGKLIDHGEVVGGCMPF